MSSRYHCIYRGRNQFPRSVHQTASVSWNVTRLKLHQYLHSENKQICSQYLSSIIWEYPITFVCPRRSVRCGKCLVRQAENVSVWAANSVVQRFANRIVTWRDKWFGGWITGLFRQSLSQIESATGLIFRAAVISIRRSARRRRGGYVPAAFICLYTRGFRVVILCEQGAAVVLVLRVLMFRVWRDGIVRVIKLGPAGRSKTGWYLY